jgi:hypothetical protein
MVASFCYSKALKSFSMHEQTANDYETNSQLIMGVPMEHATSRLRQSHDPLAKRSMPDSLLNISWFLPNRKNDGSCKRMSPSFSLCIAIVSCNEPQMAEPNRWYELIWINQDMTIAILSIAFANSTENSSVQSPLDIHCSFVRYLHSSLVNIFSSSGRTDWLWISHRYGFHALSVYVLMPGNQCTRFCFLWYQWAVRFINL